MVLLDRFVNCLAVTRLTRGRCFHRAAKHDRRRSRHQSRVRVIVSHFGKGSLAAGRPWLYLGVMMLAAPPVLWRSIVTAVKFRKGSKLPICFCVPWYSFRPHWPGLKIATVCVLFGNHRGFALPGPNPTPPGIIGLGGVVR